MKVITTTNVNQALSEVLWLMKVSGHKEDSRNGKVLALPMPLSVSYLNSDERVLFSPIRDANPYFHFFEALWMLAGRNDVAFVAHFASGMTRYSDDGVLLNGAYGHRWRKHFRVDQIKAVIDYLGAHPHGRRAVITMSDPYTDIPLWDEGLDVPCNLVITFQRRMTALDMVVFNRSNDIVWGMMGANAVHMSFLHEYVARSVGLQIGVYTQISTNPHLYLNEQGTALLRDSEPSDYYRHNVFMHTVSPYRLLIDTAAFDKDLGKFMDDPAGDAVYDTNFFNDVVMPMYDSWRAHKAKNPVGAINSAAKIRASDWCIACSEWLKRRYDNVA